MPKRTVSSVKKACDAAWSKLIRAYGRCERCGKTETLQAAHIYGRRNHALRWDERNGVCLCYACHFHWAHKEPILFAEWLEHKYPTRMKELREKFVKTEKNPIHRTLEDYVELERHLKERIKDF